MTRIRKTEERACLLSATIFIFLTNVWMSLNNCSAEVVLQDVLWTKEYNGDLDENYFGVCRFVQSPCGSDNDGVCLQRDSCQRQGGTTLGDCQGGIGECCQFVQICNGNHTLIHVNQLVSILESPTPTDTQCTFSFRKQPDICQVHLNFLNYESASADETGDCLTDRLRIRNSITVDRDFTVCGSLTDQHMYLTFGSEDSIEITPIMKNTNSRYRIEATKIPCRSGKRVPDHCLQYYTGSTGTVKSFDVGGQQQNNQKYTICVKPTELSTAIEWTPCAEDTRIRGLDIVSNIQAWSHPCNTDWVQVNGLPKVCEPFYEQSSSWKPYNLLVNFDQEELPPPPISFSMPVNLTNCPAECVDHGHFTCACLPVSHVPPISDLFTSCMCVADSSGNIQPDFSNKGFCLDYSQV